MFEEKKMLYIYYTNKKFKLYYSKESIAVVI